MNTSFFKKEILANCNADVEVLVFDKLPSTNDYAKQNLSSIKKNTVIIAKEQTHGKGRFNRKFFSTQGGLYFTLVLKENLDVKFAPFITLFTAVAVCNAIEETTNVKCNIKWVNDIFIGGKKVCGILCESSIDSASKTISDVIIGIGINVDNELNEDISSIATKLSDFCNKPINKSIILAKIIENMQDLSVKLQQTEFFTQYKNRLFILGKTVKINDEYATVLDLNNDGSLLVKTNKETKNVYSADVSIKI